MLDIHRLILLRRFSQQMEFSTRVNHHIPSSQFSACTWHFRRMHYGYPPVCGSVAHHSTLNLSQISILIVTQSLNVACFI